MGCKAPLIWTGAIMGPVSGGARHQLHWSLLPWRTWEITTVQEETLFRSVRWWKKKKSKLFLLHVCTTHSVLSQSLDRTVVLHEWWAVFSICSMCTRRKQCLLFCLFVADRAWFLLAVRPSIHKAILSLIDEDPLNYRLKQERRQQKTILVKVS